MAQITRVELIDDISGGPADETVSFGLDGTTYDIDLSAHSAGILRDILGDYVNAGRRVSKLGSPAHVITRARATAPAKIDRQQTAAVREWARSRGHEISDRGRIPVKIQQEFNAEHARKTAPELAFAG